MKRREVLRLLGSSALLATVPPFLNPNRVFAAQRSESGNFFFSPADIPRIQENRNTDLLEDHFQTMLRANLKEDKQFIKRAAGTKDLVREFARMQEILRREALVYLITGDKKRGDFALDIMRTIIKMPKWDYFLTGNETFGLQRAPGAVIYLLFTREALGDLIDQKLGKELLGQIAEKGCLPCYRALWGMEHKETVKNWHFDPEYMANYEINMERWPVILDETNLKAIPVTGLGLGALALEGIEPEAKEWLDMAVNSAKEYLQLFSPDGSYFEGMGYADYSLRNLILFMDAHQRIKGDVDWFDLANFYGLSEYLVCMQLGRDGNKPDVVNFSDARSTVHPITALWSADRGHDPLAQYAAQHYSSLFDFHDYLWYYPEQEAVPPSVSLKNKRFDLDIIVARTGWEKNDSMLAFKSGTPANHEHADRNSFIFKTFDERLLTDPFGAAYDWRQKTWLLRLTEAHNAVLIDGKGHQYNDGREGTNASLAEAKILRYVDRGDFIWWNSEATQAYHLVNEDVRFVMRSVLFIKPDVILVFDQLEKGDKPSRFSARFFPDNRDGKAKIQVHNNRFRIARPKANLFGKSLANVAVKAKKSKLDLPEKNGVFPFAEIIAAPGKQIQMVTVLKAQRIEDSGLPVIDIKKGEKEWAVTVNKLNVTIEVSGKLPEFLG